jgi:RNA polymerase II subunit A small phosphatase-like protein
MGEFEYLKDLKKIKRKGYDLNQTIMVDNTPSKLTRNYGNLVRLNDFVGNRNDRELKRLRIYLDDLVQVPNVRTVEKRGWQSRYPM